MSEIGLAPLIRNMGGISAKPGERRPCSALRLVVGRLCVLTFPTSAKIRKPRALRVGHGFIVQVRARDIIN